MKPRAALVIASKTAWDPPIRREHRLARLAAGDGHAVTFIERSVDVRAVRGRGGRAWVRGMSASAGAQQPGAIGIVKRSSLLPPHLHPISESLDGRSLSRAIPAVVGPRPTIVATLPWHWPAISRLQGYRRVLDVADDWASLLPDQRHRITELYERAADEADAIVVVSEVLREQFPGRSVEVVRNGLDGELLGAPLRALPEARRLAYVGTLSERFDAGLAGCLLDLLPGWSLDLYGPCAYARKGDRPDDELNRLLSRQDGRARWHGPIARERVAAVLDRADVLLLPNRAQSRGQDSMKIYDYSARGRPVVATAASIAGVSESPPHLRIGSTAHDLAEHVQEAVDEPVQWHQDRFQWALNQSWESRWPQWSSTLFGVAMPDELVEQDTPIHVEQEPPIQGGSARGDRIAWPRKFSGDEAPVPTEADGEETSDWAEVPSEGGPHSRERDRLRGRRYPGAANLSGPPKLRYALLCLLLSVGAGAGAYLIGTSLSPTYQASGTIRVIAPSQGAVGLIDANVTAANDLATQFAQLIGSSPVARLTAMQLGVPASDLNGALSGSTVGAQNLVQVTASAPNAVLASARAGAAVQAAESYLTRISRENGRQYITSLRNAVVKELPVPNASSTTARPVRDSILEQRASVLGQGVRDVAGNQPELQIVNATGIASEISPKPKLYAIVALIVALLITGRLAFMLSRRTRT